MMDLLKKTYQGKKVFLTGHTGFKGSWLLKTLHMMGAEIMGYALAPEDDNALYNLIGGDGLCQSVIANLLDKQAMNAAVAEFQPDFVFHLAAQPLVRLSYDVPVYTFEVNAIGTANVLEAVRGMDKLCYVICITTDKVYHNYEWVYPYRESDRLGGYDPYSASKACTELVIDSYRNSFFNIANFAKHQKSIAVGRAGNVIGGGDWAKDRLIPDVVRALSQNQKIEIRNPNAVRPWQHVLEPLIGYLTLGMKQVENATHFAQAYNFGPHFSDALPVVDMVGLSIENWGGGEYFVHQQANQRHEAGLLKLDISKAQVDLDWHPKNDAKTAVSATITWYKEFFKNPAGIVGFTEKQITDFIDS